MAGNDTEYKLTADSQPASQVEAKTMTVLQVLARQGTAPQPDMVWQAQRLHYS